MERVENRTLKVKYNIDKAKAFMESQTEEDKVIVERIPGPQTGETLDHLRAAYDRFMAFQGADTPEAQKAWNDLCTLIGG